VAGAPARRRPHDACLCERHSADTRAAGVGGHAVVAWRAEAWRRLVASSCSRVARARAHCAGRRACCAATSGRESHSVASHVRRAGSGRVGRHRGVAPSCTRSKRQREGSGDRRVIEIGRTRRRRSVQGGAPRDRVSGRTRGSACTGGIATWRGDARRPPEHGSPAAARFERNVTRRAGRGDGAHRRIHTIWNTRG
jgi:hypothetical protein